MNYIPRVVKITKPYLQDLLAKFGDIRCRLIRHNAEQIINLSKIDELVTKAEDGWYITIIDETGQTIYDTHISEMDNVHYGHGEKRW